MGSGLEVRPGPALRGSFRPPGDKSVTHRAFLLALLCGGETTVEGANPGADCAATLRCVQALGVRVAREPDRIRLAGRGDGSSEPDRVLECGNSGTTLRLLAGILAARPGLAVLSGDASLNRRPVGRVIEPLRRMGASLWARDGDRCPPLVVRGGRLQGIEYALPVASAQVASCVLFAGLQAEGTTVVTVPGPARDHTERMLAAAGAPIEIEPLEHGGRRVAVRRSPPLPGAALKVPGDCSAAAFFLAAAAARPGASVTALGVNLNPTRAGLLEVLERMGATVRRENRRTESGEEAGDVTVIGPERLLPFDIPPDWVPRLIDEVPAWVIAAARAAGRSRLAGAAELRVKETDRIAALCSNLGRLGIRALERPDGLEIEGGPVGGGAVRSERDHRIAMAFALLGTLAEGPVTIDEAAEIATSFPGFLATLRGLGGEAAGGEEAA